MVKVIITPNYAKMSVTLGLAFPGPRGLTGAGLEFNWDGTSLGVRVEGQDDYQYQDLRGPKGETGAVPNLQVGTVQTLSAGSSATVTRRSGSPDTGPIFDFGIPKGFDGEGSDARSIAYDNSESGLDATNVQDAIDAHIADYLAHKADTATLFASDYGFLYDGSDETAKMAAMMNAIPANGGKLIFDKSKEVTINGTSLINISNKQNVVIEGLRAKGSSEAVFQVTNGSKNITFRDCVFKDFGQVIYLFDCEEILVDNCTFDHTGYGVIQHAGDVSNNVKVLNCTAKNMLKDFVECNCTDTAKSKNWTIAHNHYLGGAGYPTASIEERFVGITAVENVDISHNIIENVCGDSAIHLEDIGGNIIISHNIIDNVVGDALNSYIWILHNEKTALIDGNIFLRSDTTLAEGVVYNMSTVLTNNIKFNNNIVRGVNQNLIGLNLEYHSNFSCVGNTFENCNIAIKMSFSHDMLFSSNEFNNNNYDMFACFEAQGQTTDIQVIGNKFRNTITACIEVRRNTSGTQPSQRWLIEGNTFSNDAVGYDTIDFTCIGNTIASGKELDFGKTQYVGSTGYVAANNRIIGTQALVNSGERIFTGTAAPTTGTYLKNDKVINTNPTDGAYTGWICTVAGTPGTWKGFGLIEA